MSSTRPSLPTDFELPRKRLLGRSGYIPGPSHDSFTSRFGLAFPEPEFLTSDLGVTAIYDLPPPSASGASKRPVLIVHGLNTPALGMYPLAKELQRLDPTSHFVLFDLWGHGLSSTPLVAHAPHIFHFQIFQVLSYMQWSAAHIIGYSFGGATTVSFAAQNPGSVLSAVIVAPAGLMRMDDFDGKMQKAVIGETSHEDEAIDTVLTWLEGGDLVVPSDWREQSATGRVVAEALREWERRDHAGYRHSVLSIFRDGGVMGADDQFRRFVEVVPRHIGVLGELDQVCSKEQLVQLGFRKVEVAKEADHAFVRTRVREVAGIVKSFWEGSEEGS